MRNSSSTLSLIIATATVLVRDVAVAPPPSSSSSFPPKCCRLTDELRIHPNASFECVTPAAPPRLVYAPPRGASDVIETSSRGACREFEYDSDGAGGFSFYEYRFEGGKIAGRKSADRKEESGGRGDFFLRKCCPVGYVYDSKRRSCRLKKNENDPNLVEQWRRFSNNNDDDDDETYLFVKVGLPRRCRVAVDDPISSLAALPNFPEEGGGYCVDETWEGGYVVRRCVEGGAAKICDVVRCAKKCCPDGMSFVNGPYCKDTYTEGFDLSFSRNIEDPEDPFAIVYNHTRCQGKFYLLNENRFQFDLFKDGQFRSWFNLTQSYLIEYPSEEKDGYCIEHSNRSTAKGFFFFHCLSGDRMPLKFSITKYPKMLSCVFLALTISIYFLLGQTRKIFGKILINYSVGTFLMFVLLIYAQFGAKTGQLGCRLVGFGIIFVSTVSFAWLNVMCCDIWLTFGSTKKSVGVYQRRKNLKIILGYSAYGWGMPLSLTLLTYVLSVAESLSPAIRPYVGINACFIENREGNYAQLIFLRLPHLLIQIVDGILFVKTILYCLKIKNEIQKLNENRGERKAKFNRDKEKLTLILKLAVIMGVTFTLDTATAFVNFMALGPFWRNFEIIVDCVNCLQGVFIFLIFICKKSIYRDFLKKLHIKRRENYVNNTTIADSYSSATRLNLKPGAE